MDTPLIFRVGKGDLNPIFCCKQLLVADDAEILTSYVDVADREGQEKAEAMYKMKVEALANWVVPFPTGVKIDGKKMKRPDETLDSPELVREFFKDFGAATDWISEYAFNLVRNNCQPTVSFFDVSLQ
jgi:hypothetical protein